MRPITRVRHELARELALLEESIDVRLVDFGIELHVVEQDLERGEVVIPGTPAVRVLRSHRFGGLVDSRRHRLVHSFRGSEQGYRAAGGVPVVWFCSTAQERLLVRTASTPEKAIVYGAFGGGKTRLLAMLGVLLSISLCENGFTEARELFGGVTAPTQERREIMVKTLREVCPEDRNWYRYRAKRCDWSFPALGVTLEVRAAHQQSADTGNPIQGQNWSFALPDELQDQTPAYPHILARGRSAPDGVYPVIASATAKDNLAWREFRDSLAGVAIERLEGRSNPFVPVIFWDGLQRLLSERDYRRMVLAQDVGPERAIYPAWARGQNVAPIPRIGAADVTARVLGGWQMLVGHDPGILRNASVLLKAYRVAAEEFFRWYVVGEFVTDLTTSREHAERLAQFIRSSFQLRLVSSQPSESQVLVRNDPWGETDHATHKSVYHEFEHAGFCVKSAAYTRKAEGRGRVHLRASVEMLNSLFRSASGRRRLYVQQGDEGRPMAPHLIRCIELSEWDRSGDHEIGRKDDKDKDPTDLPSALRYALWPYERSRHDELAMGVAP